MTYELQAVRINQLLSQETTAFTATLHRDGGLIAFVKNRGNGGAHLIEKIKPEDMQRLKTDAGERGVESFINDLLDEWLDKSFRTRLLLCNVIFRLKGDEAGAYRTVRRKRVLKTDSQRKQDAEEIRQWLESQYGDRLEMVEA